MTTEQDIFDAAVKLRERSDEVGFAKEIMVLGLLHYYKNDKALDQENKGSPALSAEQRQAIVDNFTTQNHTDYREISATTLARYAEQHPSEKSFWGGVWQNIVGAFCYSLLLLCVLWIIRILGIDLLSALGLKGLN